MKIIENIDEVITMELTIDELSYHKNVIKAYIDTIPSNAYATYAGFDKLQIELFLKQLCAECERFGVKI